jgi:amidase
MQLPENSSLTPAADVTPAADEVCLLEASELSRNIRARRLSCREVMTAYLSRIARLNPAINAIVSMQDETRLLREADARDDELAHGNWRGFLHGFPHAVKDMAATAGIRTTMGSPLLANFVPQHDAIFVERLKKAGVVIIGKTNTPEFGLGSQTYNTVFGATRNAYDPTRTAGGSSGGAASALAMRLLPVADGSDMGGSLRNPAAFNNVYGFRPSAGRVPQGPSLDVFIAQLGTDGPMARTVEDLAQLLAVMAGYDARAPLSLADNSAIFAGDLNADIKGKRIAWLGHWSGHIPLEPGITDLCEAGLRVLQNLGCSIEPVLPDFPPEDIWRTWVTLRQFLVRGALSAFADDPLKSAELKPEVQWEIESSRKLTAHDIYRATARRTAWYKVVLALFDKYDFLALPSAQVFPFAVETHWPTEIAGRTMDTYHRWMEVVVSITLTGCPAISVPVGFNGAGLPMGMQLVGRPRGDLDVLRLAHAYDIATRWPQQRPAMS